MWKNLLEPDRPQMSIRRMGIACWIPKAANRHSRYVIFIAFTLYRYLQESASMLRLYVLRLSCFNWHQKKECFIRTRSENSPWLGNQPFYDAPQFLIVCSYIFFNLGHYLLLANPSPVTLYSAPQHFLFSPVFAIYTCLQSTVWFFRY